MILYLELSKTNLQRRNVKSACFGISILSFTGYGHIYPRTLNGQLFTIVYSLVAMGITLVMLANVGAALADALIYSYRLNIKDINIQNIKIQYDKKQS